jgi:16S rRNA G966 N2-methylase RsmD
MRITGGAARGRALRAPRGLKVRPTADKVRAAIFNILASRTDIAGGRWLDLFAGTGALGLEALSRGAARVTFIDDSRESCATTSSAAASPIEPRCASCRCLAGYAVSRSATSDSTVHSWTRLIAVGSRNERYRRSERAGY